MFSVHKLHVCLKISPVKTTQHHWKKGVVFVIVTLPNIVQVLEKLCACCIF